MWDLSGHMPASTALAEVKKFWKIKRNEIEVPIEQAIGHVCYENIYSKLTIPVCRSAMIDSIGIRTKDFAEGMPETGHWQQGIDYCYADMGDDFDDRFDAAIAVESVSLDENGLQFLETLTPKVGDGINKRGSLVEAGELLIKKETLVTPTIASSLISAGITALKIIVPPKVAFIPTGSELVPPGIKPERGQVVDCNSVMMEAYLNQWGATPRCYPIVRDNVAQLAGVLEDALAQNDIVLINGGSSKGSEDFCTNLLRTESDFFQHYFMAVPGRPAAISVKGSKIIVNIPGPTMAAFAVGHWLIKTLIQWYLFQEPIGQQPITARMKNSSDMDTELQVCAWFKVERENDEWVATGMFRERKMSEVFATANAYTFLQPGKNSYQVGDLLEMYWIDPRI